MPTRDTAWPDGTPCWVDYGAPDMAAAKVFYADLLGWTYTEEDPAFGGYVNALLGGSQVAGLGPQQDTAGPPAWTTYFATSDIAEHVRRVSEAGGRIVVPPMEVGPMGSMAVAVDPQGHPFGLWQAGTHTGVQRYSEPGSLSWNEAAVDDPAAARDFYTAVFDHIWDDLPGVEGYATFRGGDRGPEHPFGGLGAAQPGLPEGWATCFAVASTDAAVAAVRSAGGAVLSEPEDTPFGRFAVVRDPWGAPFEVIQ